MFGQYITFLFKGNAHAMQVMTDLQARAKTDKQLHITCDDMGDCYAVVMWHEDHHEHCCIRFDLRHA